MSDLTYTHIHENVRAYLGISRDEYALCSYAQTWQGHPKNTHPGWCDRSLGQIAAWLGVTVRGLRKMSDRMVECGLLERGPAGRLRITEYWFSLVSLAKKEEQSSFSDEKEEQSSLSSDEKRELSSSFENEKGNKVPPKRELSSSFEAKKRNLVPTHNNSNIVINNSFKKEKLVTEKATEKKSNERLAPTPQAWGGFIDIAAAAAEMKTDQLYKETLIREKIPAQAIDELLDIFSTQKIADGANYVASREFRQHFRNWALRNAHKAKTHEAPTTGIGDRFAELGI
jgi:hypothetical protein